jgi:uncharacterized delta-60 repeat protein
MNLSNLTVSPGGRVRQEGEAVLEVILYKGCLDGTFGSGAGVVLPPIVAGKLFNAMALQSDGKILAAGSGGWILSRYNPDGSLDSTFANGGIGNYAISGTVRTMAVQADGRIVLGGSYSIGTFELGRINPDGSVDPSFGTAGFVTLDFGKKEIASAYHLAIQSDGKIVVIPSLSSSTALLRFNSNGTLDSTFGSNGKVTLSYGPRMLLLQTIGTEQRIVASGGGNSHFMTARFLPDGQVDTSFGPSGTGYVSTSFCSYGDGAFTIAADSTGRLLVGGSTVSGPNGSSDENFALTRYTSTGLPDASFGKGGKLTVDGNFNWPSSSGGTFAIDNLGRVVFGGMTTSAPTVFRLNADGSMDTSFSAGVFPGFPYQIYGSDVLTLNGAIIIGGTMSDNSGAWMMKLVP